jgi:hypothetical protein
LVGTFGLLDLPCDFQPERIERFRGRVRSKKELNSIQPPLREEGHHHNVGCSKEGVFVKAESVRRDITSKACSKTSGYQFDTSSDFETLTTLASFEILPNAAVDKGTICA